MIDSSPESRACATNGMTCQWLGRWNYRKIVTLVIGGHGQFHEQLGCVKEFMACLKGARTARYENPVDQVESAKFPQAKFLAALLLLLF